MSTHREASPTLRLEAGDYIVNVAFGRAHLTRKIAVSSERPLQERFVLNAGGLRLAPALANGEAVNEQGGQLRDLLRRARPVRAENRR